MTILKGKILAVALLLSCSLMGWGQSEEADKLYEDLGYKAAIPEYEKLESLSEQDLIRVATSYRLNHDTENAERWYAQVVQVSQEPINFFYYAQALQSNGRLDLAKENYLKYHEMLGGEATDKRGQLLAQAIDRMAEFKHTGVQIKNEEPLNTGYLDFSPSYYRNGIVFVSSRGTEKDKGFKDKWIDDNFMALFFSEKDKDGNLGKPKPFSYALTTRYHEGPVTFVQNGRKIFFTRNDYNKGKRRNNSKGIMKQNIYSASYDREKWSEASLLPFNTVEYEEVHPSISPDGRVLYFASDRPGGYGQMDLYKVEFKGGQWGAPINLGPNVNTPGNDLFPFIHDDGTLYFSSDGWGGIGGLDIFSTYSIGDSVWVKSQNVGTPFNSPKDDFGFIINTTGTEGYLSSDRDDGYGQDDIYSFKLGRPVAKKKEKIESVICVYDGKTSERLIGAKVTVKEVNEEGRTVELDEDFIMRLVETEVEDEYILKLKKDLSDFDGQGYPTYTSDENGEFRMELDPEKTYLFEAEKNGYLAAEKTLEPGISEFCIPMEDNNCLVLEGLTKNQKFKDKIIPNTKVTMVSLCTGEEVTITSDARGNFSFPCLECDCEYVLKGEKKNFKPGVGDVSTIGKDCDAGGVLTLDLLLMPAGRNELLFAGQKLEVGTKVELKNIFYDFDQYYIRDDARPDLDQVVELMRTFPTMVIELGSHTDARGTDSYNRTLSQNRANAAVEYIISRGIDRNRLVARGYGESQPRNHCRNFVKCTEEEHQFNRRTEIRILSHNEPNLQFEYIDNRPKKIDKANPARRFTWE